MLKLVISQLIAKFQRYFPGSICFCAHYRTTSNKYPVLEWFSKVLLEIHLLVLTKELAAGFDGGWVGYETHHLLCLAAMFVFAFRNYPLLLYKQFVI